jgi:hypothetical protein
MARRLVDLEALDKERQGRVYNRVLDRVLERYTKADQECFMNYVKRATANPDTETTENERRVLCLVESLTMEDPEVRPCDLIGLPDDWMREYGYGEVV